MIKCYLLCKLFNKNKWFFFKILEDIIVMVMLMMLGIMLIVEFKKKLVDIYDRYYMYMYMGYDVY